MKLYLLRHADADPGADDALRPISAKGQTQLRDLGRQLAASGIDLPREWYHSDLRRARETGLLLNSHMQGHFILREKSGLRPEDPIPPLLPFLESSPRDLLLIGHNPLFAQLLAHLLTGDPYAGIAKFGKAHLYCLEYGTMILPVHGAVRRWSLRWILTPRLCRREKAPVKPATKTGKG